MSGRTYRRGFGRGTGREESRENEQDGPDALLNDLTGNGIVNNGPDDDLGGLGAAGADNGIESADGSADSSASESAGGSGTGTEGGPGTSGDAGGPDGGLSGEPGRGPGRDFGRAFGRGSERALGSELDEDELALRRLMHSAVEDLEPSDGVLDHLRKAVPTRRARKRQAVVGMAAAAILFGTAVPAFVHVAGSGGAGGDHSVNAGHGEQAQGGAGTGKSSGGSGAMGRDGFPSGAASAGENEPGRPGAPEADASGSTDGATGSASHPAGGSSVASSPTCGASQLGVTTAEAGAPDSTGKVYGIFRVANVSGAECAVTGRGSISFLAGGAADPSRINVVEHTSGDAAIGLPDPSQESAALVLAPNGAYEVRFAWVPADSCPTTGATPDPTPPAEGSTGTTGGTGESGAASSGTGSESANAETKLRTEASGVDGNVSVSLTAEAGAPSAQATIPNACVGTIYRTGVLSAS
ncbi:hypothetical protein [Streptomyces sp. NPDC051569]|uniref:hypothetical protein n=1 Tax=Streptomyces sp. NPDC051569 TaxID=3365661 RepID=UPI0037882638